MDGLYHYTDCGLPNVWLDGGVIYHDKQKAPQHLPWGLTSTDLKRAFVSTVGGPCQGLNADVNTEPPHFNAKTLF